MNKNALLKNFIIEKYGSIPKFLKKEEFSGLDLETVFYKKNIFHEIGIGINLCKFLNFDVVRLFCHNEIVFIENIAPKEFTEVKTIPADEIIKDNFVKLDAEKRKKVLEYADYLFEFGDGT